MRVRRRTAGALWRAWLAALALTLVYAATTVATTPRAPAPGASLRLARLLPATPPPLVSRLAADGGVLLPLPAALPASALVPESNVTAAAPFSPGPASKQDRARALRCLADAVYYESAGEPEAGQRGVAQVILNRVRHAGYPSTVCGVVYQGAPGRGCQFSFACDGSLARVPSASGWAQAARIAAAALGGRVEPAVGLATYYHTYAVAPAWNRGLVMTGAIGAHFFHRWAGDLGTAAAFGRRYRGCEPALPLPAASPAPVAAAAAPGLMTNPAVMPPRTAAPPRADPLALSGAVLPRWRDSGKPL